jgi:hypothetical protein
MNHLTPVLTNLRKVVQKPLNHRDKPGGGKNGN